MIRFRNLTWEELINYHPNTPYKKRPIILVELDDNFNQRYNAIVVKYDEAQNLHIRYLDNPFYENKYWWTGNKQNRIGLNPLVYKAKFLGDDEDEMFGLTPDDFVEDGYDDIINFRQEPHRFFRTVAQYPFLEGIQGNVHVHNYYVSIFNSDLSGGELPDCIKNKIKYSNPRRVKPTKTTNGDILEVVMDILPIEISPDLMEYHRLRGNKTAEVALIQSFKKYLSLLISYQFINKYMKKIGMKKEELLNIKEELNKGFKVESIVYLLPYLFSGIKYQVVIFECLPKDLEIQKFGYEEDDVFQIIYFLRYQNRLELII